MIVPPWRFLIPLLMGVALLSVLTVIWPLVFVVVVACLIAGWVLVRVFNNPFLGVLWLVFLLPFEWVGSADIGGVTVRLSHLMGIWTTIAWLWQQVRRGGIRLRPNPLLLPLCAFLLIYFAGLAFALNLQRGVMVFAFTLLMGVIFVMVADLVDTRVRLAQVIKVWVGTAFAVSLFGLFQWVGDTVGLPPSITQIRWGWYNKEILGMTRLHSTALEPLYFANYALTILPTMLAFLLAPRVVREKTGAPFSWFIMLLAAGAMGLAFVLTLSRGGYLGLAAAVLVLGILRFRQLFSKRVLGLVTLGVVAIVGFLGVTAATGSELNLNGLFDRATTVGESKADLERFEAYREAYDAWLSAPWLGIGAGNFGPYVAGQYVGAPHNGWTIVNNVYLELLAETGLIGSLIFLMLIGIWLIGVWRALTTRHDPFLQAVGMGFLAGLVGILIQYLTFSTLYIAHIWVFLAVGVAAGRLAQVSAANTKFGIMYAEESHEA